MSTRLNIPLTISRAEASCSWDHREGGAAVHGPEVVFHVGVHVWVRVAERRLCRSRRMWGKTDERDIRDNRATAQSRRSVKESERFSINVKFAQLLYCILWCANMLWDTKTHFFLLQTEHSTRLKSSNWWFVLLVAISAINFHITIIHGGP